MLEDPDKEETVVSVVMLLLFDLKLKPLLALWYELVELVLKSFPSRLLLLSERVRESEREVVVVLARPILKRRFLRISESLAVTEGWAVALVSWRLMLLKELALLIWKT